MSASPPPPPYSESESESSAPCPSYCPEQPIASSSRAQDTPSSFRVGLHDLLDPLVQIKHLKLHLLFLGALHDLRRRVESSCDGSLPPLIGELDGEHRWSWFVNLAVERFQRWVEHLPLPSKVNTLEKFVRRNLPPLDVWMVLHAYMLNPQSFAEDSIRIESLRPLAMLAASLPDFFFDSLDTINDMTLWKPHATSRSNWVSKTGLPFDPFESATFLQHQELLCPKCKAVISVSYITASGTGYAQQNFSYTCSSCAFQITRERLAVAKLTTDLTAHLLHESQPGIADVHLFLPYTLRTEFGEDRMRAVVIKQAVLSLKPINQFNSRKWRQDQSVGVALAESLKWKLTEVQKSFLSLQRPKIGAKILGAYCDQRPFSTELVGAVLRQSSFVKKIHNLDWTSPCYFEKREDAVALHYAIVRYHAFLDLMSSSQRMLVVPTLDIDLVWHSHQLFGPRYHKDCKTNIGRYIDHDDKVEQFHLSDAFDSTCRAWEKRYGMSYTQCGCPLPGNTIGQRFARFVTHAGSRHYPLSRLAPPTDQPEILAASHPSDHNTVAVLGLPSNTTAKAQRESKAFRRREREASRLQKGEITQEEFKRNVEHTVPFLVPVPLTSAVMTPCTPLGQVMSTNDRALGSFAGCASDSGAACFTGSVDLNEGYVGSIDPPWPRQATI